MKCTKRSMLKIKKQKGGETARLIEIVIGRTTCERRRWGHFGVRRGGIGNLSVKKNESDNHDEGENFKRGRRWGKGIPGGREGVGKSC